MNKLFPRRLLRREKCMASPGDCSVCERSMRSIRVLCILRAKLTLERGCQETGMRERLRRRRSLSGGTGASICENMWSRIR
jgi:hypothetical protein